MKLGIVTQSYYPKPGGVTEVVYYSAVELRRRGHQVTVITSRFGNQDQAEAGVERIGRNILFPANGAWTNVTAGCRLRGQLERIFRRERFDIVQTHCPLVPTLPLLAATADRAGAKLVGTFHAAAESNALYNLFRAPLRRIAAGLDHRIAVSRAAADFASRYFPGEFEIIPNGIDCRRFAPDVAPAEGLRDGRFNILFVGRMDRRKGLPYLFRALPLIQRSLPRPVRLILVGEGTLRQKLTPRPRDLGGAEIVAAGRIEPDLLPRYYTAADVFCAPATGRESFGIVLLEAMASRLPIVASDIPGFSRVVSHGGEGLLVEPRAPEALAEAVARIALDPALARRLGAAGREKAQTYRWETVAERLEDCFLRVLMRDRKEQAAAAVPVTAG